MPSETQDSSLNEKRVVVTRAAVQSHTFVAALEQAGARVLNMPMIETVPNTEAKCPEDLAGFDWLVVTSVNSVQYFEDCLHSAGKSYSNLLHCRVAAIGEATARALRSKGLETCLVPQPGVSDALAKAIGNSETRPRDKKVLLPQGSLAKSDIIHTLEQHGMLVTPVVCYKTLYRRPSPEEITLLLDFLPDAITFFSPSAVESFAASDLPDRLASRIRRIIYISIGPVTTRALEDARMTPAIESSRQCEEGLVEALKAYYQ